MDIWGRARTLAEEAAKKSQELTEGLGSANLSDVVSEASKRSMELAAEASKISKEFAAQALKRADEMKAQIPPPAVVLNSLVDSDRKDGDEAVDLEKFGVTEELREFVQEITASTFRDFPLADDSEVSDIPTVSNVQQDLTEWQERHAKLVLTTVQDIIDDLVKILDWKLEISKLRFQLCPRVMKERKFWRIYFILVNSHVEPYEKRYMEDIKAEAEMKQKADEISKAHNNNAKSAASEKDLDVFLLGDEEDSDDGPDDGIDGFDDDLDML